MEDFFFTFGSADVRARQYVRITARDESDARELMFKEYGKKWGFCYDARRFDGQVEKYGLTELQHLKTDTLRNNGE